MSASSSASAPGWSLSVKGAVVRGPLKDKYDTILTNEAVQFLADLHRKFEQTRRSLLSLREHRQIELDRGVLPDFNPLTASIRGDPNWRGPASLPADLTDRRVEITGPVDRKMIINALNSGARVFMADLEDSSAPTWDNVINGQVNLRDAVNRQIEFRQGDKVYQLKKDVRLATIMMRPRGWHLPEAHIQIDGDVMSGSLFDFGLYFFHNARNLVQRGSGPYFYLPKMESHLEARLWNDVFVFAQGRLGLPTGTIRATVLIETILGSFEMEEIIYELREHSAGLNLGRWDYIFSHIKKLRAHRDYVLPDRSQVTMTTPFMDNYVKLLIATCHKRGVHAMGGMAAQIPISNNPTANDAATAKVKADKLREVQAGCDGTWVAHPALIPIAMQIFDEHMPQANQLSRPITAVAFTSADMLGRNVAGAVTVDGLRSNIDIGLDYLESWLRGVGCVPLHNLMEDAATAEISRCQIWQWLKHGVTTKEGEKVTKAFVTKLLQEYVQQVKQRLGDDGYKKRKYELALQLYDRLLFSDRLEDFLTLVAYPHITTIANGDAGARQVRSNL